MSIENAESQMNSLESEIANALNSMDSKATKDLNLDSASNEDPNTKIDNFAQWNKIEQTTNPDGSKEWIITIQTAWARGGTFETATRSFKIPTINSLQKLKDDNKLYQTDENWNIQYTDEAIKNMKRLKDSMWNMDIAGKARKQETDDNGDPLFDEAANNAIQNLNDDINNSIGFLYDDALTPWGDASLFQNARDVL